MPIYELSIQYRLILYIPMPDTIHQMLNRNILTCLLLVIIQKPPQNYDLALQLAAEYISAKGGKQLRRDKKEKLIQRISNSSIVVIT